MRTFVETPVRPSGDVMRIVGTAGGSSPRRAAWADVNSTRKTASAAVARLDFMGDVVASAAAPADLQTWAREAISRPFRLQKHTEIMIAATGGNRISAQDRINSSLSGRHFHGGPHRHRVVSARPRRPERREGDDHA